MVKITIVMRDFTYLKVEIKEFLSYYFVKQTFKIQLSEFEDGIMKVDIMDNSIIFNSKYIEVWGKRYYTAVILHETVHAEIQRIYNKSDVHEMKSIVGGGWDVMQADIEADLKLWNYLYNHKKWTKEEILEIQFMSRNVFPKTEKNNFKICRDVGSVFGLMHILKTGTEYKITPKTIDFMIGNKLIIYKPSKMIDKFDIYITEKLFTAAVTIHYNTNDPQMTLQIFIDYCEILYNEIANALIV